MKALVPILLVVAAMVGAFWLDRPQEPADLTFINRGEVHTIDPQRMSWLQDFRVADAVYEGVVRYNKDTMEVEPAVAYDWDVSPDGITYTFHFRDDAKWSNGAPVTAHDFVYSWKRGMMPDMVAGYAGMYLKINGAKQFFDWRKDKLAAYARDTDKMTRDQKKDYARQLLDQTDEMFDHLVGLHAPDDHTLVVDLDQSTPYMLDLFAFGVFMPVYRPVVDEYVTLDPDTGMLQMGMGWTKPPHLVSNGPYMMTLWRYKRDMRLEKNPYYWERDTVRANSILILSVEDPNTAVQAFETGTIDWLSEVAVEYRADMVAQLQKYLDRNADRIAQLKAQGLTQPQYMAILAQESPPRDGERNNIHAYPAYGTYFYNFNCQPKLNNGAWNPFYDKRCRQAFARAIDKAAIVRNVTRMNQPVANVLIPPGSIPGFNGAKGIGYDPEKARKILAELGWTDRDGDGLIENDQDEHFPTVEILFPSSGEHKAIAQAIANMWERNLGVATRLREEETKVAATHLVEHNFMVARGNWYGDYGDPTTFLDLERTGDSNNDRNYSNPEFDAIMAQSDAEVDPEKRMRLLEQADAIVTDEDVPLVPLYHQVTLYMFDPARLRGISTHPRLAQFLGKMYVEKN